MDDTKLVEQEELGKRDPHITHDDVMAGATALADARREIAAVGKSMGDLRDYLNETSAQYRRLQELKDKRRELREKEKRLKRELGEAAVFYRQHFGQKKIAPGVSVADYVVVDYDNDEAVRWALNNAQAFVELDWARLADLASKEPVNGDREKVIAAREARDAAVRFAWRYDIGAFRLLRHAFDGMARGQADRIPCVDIAYDPRPRISSDLSMYESGADNE